MLGLVNGAVRIPSGALCKLHGGLLAVGAEPGRVSRGEHPLSRDSGLYPVSGADGACGELAGSPCRSSAVYQPPGVNRQCDLHIRAAGYSGRAFYLLSFYCFVRYRKAPRLWYAVLTGIFFLLALGSKEMGITLPAVCLVYDFTQSFSGQGGRQQGQYWGGSGRQRRTW